MEFDFTRSVTHIDVSDYVHPILYNHFSNDGRAFGNIAEDVLSHMFSNLIKKEDNDYYDLDTLCKKRVEVRTKNFSFEASSNCGKGRCGKATDDTAYKIANVTDWLFINISEFPRIAIYHVDGEAAKLFWKTSKKTTKKLTPKQFEKGFK
jgi:hypothetical protein